MPVVEAMSFGLPVLLSDIPPHREITMGLGEYFMPTDMKTLADKMINMDFSRRNYNKTILNVFSDDNTAAKYVSLFNSLNHKNNG